MNAAPLSAAPEQKTDEAAEARARYRAFRRITRPHRRAFGGIVTFRDSQRVAGSMKKAVAR